jgi:polyhydroxyalkanoate synthesis regulator phasin
VNPRTVDARARWLGEDVQKAGQTVKPVADKGASRDAGQASIARVLVAERDAREAVERARQEVDQIAEGARAASRAVAERTERRIRAIVSAFEREAASRVAEIDAEADRLDSPQPLNAEELAALQRAVLSLARDLIGGAS